MVEYFLQKHDSLYRNKCLENKCFWFSCIVNSKKRDEYRENKHKRISKLLE